jgi:hypothetical protein
LEYNRAILSGTIPQEVMDALFDEDDEENVEIVSLQTS